MGKVAAVAAPDILARFFDTSPERKVKRRLDPSLLFDLCTREYTESWIAKIKELRKWIEQML